MRHSNMLQKVHGLSRLATTNQKVALQSNSQEYELAIARSTSTPYKMLKRIGNDLSWQDIKRN